MLTLNPKFNLKSTLTQFLSFFLKNQSNILNFQQYLLIEV